MSKEIDEANQELCKQRQTILKLQEILNDKQDLDENTKKQKSKNILHSTKYGMLILYKNKLML